MKSDTMCCNSIRLEFHLLTYVSQKTANRYVYMLYFTVLPWPGMETKYRINNSFKFIETETEEIHLFIF